MGLVTQQDPIGIAGGLNLYGYANGDPVNYSDPFGLCIEDDQTCEELVATLRGLEGDAFQSAADAFDAYQGGNVYLVGGDDQRLDPDGLNSDSDFDTFVGGSYNRDTGTVLLNQDLSQGDFLIAAVHESLHLPTGANQFLHTSLFRQTEYNAYQQLGADLQAKAKQFFWRLRDSGFPVSWPPPAGR